MLNKHSASGASCITLEWEAPTGTAPVPKAVCFFSNKFRAVTSVGSLTLFRALLPRAPALQLPPPALLRASVSKTLHAIFHFAFIFKAWKR